MIKIALGIVIGSTTMALANYTDAHLGTIIRSIVVDGVHYPVCVPPWATTDSFGVVHDPVNNFKDEDIKP